MTSKTCNAVLFCRMDPMRNSSQTTRFASFLLTLLSAGKGWPFYIAAFFLTVFAARIYEHVLFYSQIFIISIDTFWNSRWVSVRRFREKLQ
ncbi:hypothetical protein M3J09_003213 [Ascochyta lentis]